MEEIGHLWRAAKSDFAGFPPSIPIDQVRMCMLCICVCLSVCVSVCASVCVCLCPLRFYVCIYVHCTT